MTIRSQTRRAIVAIATLSLGLTIAHAQSYPTKPIRLVVPFPAGGTTDIVGRLVAKHLGDRLGQTVVVDNRGGAGGMIGAAVVANGDADGYTLLMGTAEIFGIAESMSIKVPFNAATDFVPIALVSRVPSVIVVNPKVPVNNLQELIALAKANPGKLHFGSPGTGTNIQLIGEMFNSRLGLAITHVPYKGGAPAVTDLMGGQIEMMPAGVSGIAPRVKAGQLKALAITSEARSSILPDVPTMAEAGVSDFVVGGWFGILAKAGTPPSIVQRLEKEMAAIAQLPEFHASLVAAGGDGMTLVGEPFGAFIKSETKRWREIVKAAGIKPEA